MILSLSYFYDMIKIIKKVSVVFRGSSAVFRFMEHLHFRPRGAGDDRFHGLFALPGLALDFRDRGRLISRLCVGPVRSGHSLFCHKITSGIACPTGAGLIPFRSHSSFQSRSSPAGGWPPRRSARRTPQWERRAGSPPWGTPALCRGRRGCSLPGRGKTAPP